MLPPDEATSFYSEGTSRAAAAEANVGRLAPVVRKRFGGAPKACFLSAFSRDTMLDFIM
jgi:hypothetical protein